MSNVIILSAAQASLVRGYSDRNPPGFPLARLDPIPLKDGTFMLGVEVLNDPRHVRFKNVIASLTIVDMATLTALLPDSVPKLRP